MKKYIAFLMTAVVLIGVIVPSTGIKAGASSDMTQVEMIIKHARSLIGSTAYDGYCQKFVRICYEAAGIYSNESIPSAIDARNKWVVSESRENIPVGAVLYFDTSEYGHAAIYIGNNKIIDARATVSEREIPERYWTIYKGWGWQGGTEPTGVYIESDEPIFGNIWVTNDNLSLRAGPGIDYSVIMQITKGTQVSVTDQAQKNGTVWGKISYKKYTGWISLGYCRFLYTLGNGIIAASATEKVIRSVSLISIPKKRYYRQGESIYTSGLSLMVTYEDRTTSVESDGFMINNLVAGNIGQNIVTVNYKDFINTYSIVVLSKENELKNLNLNETDFIKMDFANSAIAISSNNQPVDSLSDVLGTGATVYSQDGEQKQFGEAATGDYVMMNNKAVVICRKGDINGSGSITVADYLYIKRIFLGTTTAADCFENACDVNNDGKIDALDFLLIKRYVAGTAELFKVQTQ